ncbi:MAG: IS256 family transposase, partial [Clostridia bacterium]
MAGKNRTPEENERGGKIREKLRASEIRSTDGIQNLFKETIAGFMENEPDAELDDELGFSKYDCRNKGTDNSWNGHGGKMLHTSFG